MSRTPLRTSEEEPGPTRHGHSPGNMAVGHKQNLTTNEIKIHKARLNIHGGKQVYDVNYYETYAPVVTWFATLLSDYIDYILTMS
jgi:hypothetical protein